MEFYDTVYFKGNCGPIAPRLEEQGGKFPLMSPLSYVHGS